MTKFLNNLSSEPPQNTTKDNHVISQFLLRNFWDNENNSLYYNKYSSTQHFPIFKNNKYQFKNMFSRFMIYSDTTESDLSTLENKAANTLQKITQNKELAIGENCFTLLNLTENEKHTLVLFYQSLFFRILTSEKSKEIISNIITSSNINDIINENEDYKNNVIYDNLITPFIEANRTRLEQDLNEDYLFENIHNTHLIFSHLEKNIEKSKIIVLKDNNLILSNFLYICPTVSINNIDNSLKDFQYLAKQDILEFILPISKNMFLYYKNSVDNNAIEDILTRYNLFIFKHGTEFLFFNDTINKNNIPKSFYSIIQEEYIEPTTKENHIIPQFMLRHFSQKKTYQSSYINLQTNEKKHPVYKKNKNKIMFPKMFSLNKFFNNNLEQYFSKTETSASPLILKIVNYANNNLDYNQFSFFVKKETNKITFNAISIDYFNFSQNELIILANFYSDIIFRLAMSHHQEDIDDNYLDMFCKNFYEKINANFEVDNFILTQQLLNFKQTILKSNKDKITMEMNDFFNTESKSKVLISNLIHSCLMNQSAFIITFNSPIITISNTIPFSWYSKCFIFPISCNSILYIQKNVTSLYNVQINIVKLYHQYCQHIYKNGTEFLFFDNNISNQFNENLLIKSIQDLIKTHIDSKFML